MQASILLSTTFDVRYTRENFLFLRTKEFVVLKMIYKETKKFTSGRLTTEVVKIRNFLIKWNEDERTFFNLKKKSVTFQITSLCSKVRYYMHN